MPKLLTHRAPPLNPAHTSFSGKCVYSIDICLFFLIMLPSRMFNLYTNCVLFPCIIPNGIFWVQSIQGIRINPKNKNFYSTIELLTVSDCADGTSLKTVQQRNIHSATTMMLASEECYVTSSILCFFCLFIIKKMTDIITNKDKK